MVSNKLCPYSLVTNLKSVGKFGVPRSNQNALGKKLALFYTECVTFVLIILT